MPKSFFKTLTAALAVALAAGCGGGGGGGGGSTTASAAAASWTQEAYLKASNADANDRFGMAVAVDADTKVVGAQFESGNAASAGAAYVYRRTGTTWTQEALLTASNADASDFFGISVAVSGDTVVVGASGEDGNSNSVAGEGAVYVFKRTGTTWAQEAYLKGSAIAAGSSFGYAVAISGDTIVAGAHGESAGAAYVFKRTGATWAQEARLTAPNAEVGDDFGYSVAIAGDTVVVGAASEASGQTTITNGNTGSADNSAPGAGAAYVFKRTGTTWAQEAYLKAPNAGASDYFGESVAVAGDTVVVGASGEASNQTTITNGTSASGNDSAGSAGAAYVFKRTGTTWAQEAYLKAPNAEAGDLFGISVAVSGDAVVVGAPNESSSQRTVTNGSSASGNNSASLAGAAYVFTRSGSTWAQSAYLKAPNADANDRFGVAVWVDAGTVAVGAFGESSSQATITNGATASSDNAAVESGAAYVFRYR